MEAKFNHYDLKLIVPDFSSPVTDLIIDLDYLRKKKIGGTTHPATFFQLKSIFHTLESIGSARIEGNRTTIAAYIETKIFPEETKDEGLVEIRNMETALQFIDKNVENSPINRAFLCELHKIVVTDLDPNKEGDFTPDMFRVKNVSIRGSLHRPPDYTQVSGYMDELFEFINRQAPSKLDLLKTAIAHHRFAWVHPFTNGNGRTVRLLTYAMLVKQGFNVDAGGRILNPTAVFCANRKKYYNFLSLADSGENDKILSWCEYVLSGLKNEIEKIDRLLDYNFLSSNILIPAINFSLERKHITGDEHKILKIAIEKQILQASHIKNIFPDKIPAEISRMLRGLKDKKMIISEKPNTRKYVLCFNNNYLLRGIITMLAKNDFLLNEDK